MSILETLLSSAGGGAVKQAARQFGIDSAAAESLLQQLVPALAGGMQRNLAQGNGAQALQQALAAGNHQRYVDDPAALQEPATREDGNAILGHLLGSKEVSRNVASQAAAQTGLDAGLIKKFLPIVAAATMGAVSKQTSRGSGLVESGGSMLMKLLDSDGDGQVTDNLLSLGRKLL